MIMLQCDWSGHVNPFKLDSEKKRARDILVVIAAAARAIPTP
jgi:hypothetical protein